MAYGAAEFVGPTPAELQAGSDAQFQKSMLGIAEMLNTLTQQKTTAANAKLKAQQEQDKQDVTNIQGVLDTLVKNSPTGSISEVAKSPEGQAVIAQLYGKMGMSKDLIAPLISQLANNPYNADQLHQAFTTQYAGEQATAAQQQAAAQAQTAKNAVAPQVVQGIPAGVPPGAPPLGTTGQAPVASPQPAISVPSTPGASPGAAYPDFMQQALGNAPESAAPAATQAPSPQQAKQQDVQAKQGVQQDARAQAQVVAQDAGPSAAAIFLRKQLDPNSVEFLTAYAAKNPSEYYKDLDPKHMEAFQANIDKTLEERRKLGLEGDEISTNLQTLSEKNKTGITYTKALTLQALMAASTAQVNAKLASVSYQMNNAVLNQFLKSAQDREDEANKMYASVTAKGAKATVADVAHLNSLVEQANSYYKQANRVITTMHVTLGGNPKQAPQFADVPAYILSKDGGLVGGFSNMITGALQGAGAQTGQVTRGGTGAPAAPTGPSAGVGSPQAGGAATGAAAGGKVPSGYTPEQQKMADDILKELSQ